MSKLTKTQITAQFRLIAAALVVVAATRSATAWPLTVLHTFPQYNGTYGSGVSPNGGLLWLGDGNLYGTTSGGGDYGGGTVFSISPAGAFLDQQRFFAPPPPNTVFQDGSRPLTGLTLFTPMAGQGVCFGVCYNGGNTFNSGTLFEFTPGSYFGFAYTFTGGGVDGGFPEGALVVGSDGSLYGTTTVGPTNNAGTIFQMTPVFNPPAPTTVTRTELYTFTGGFDGAHPAGALVQGVDGKFYGTTTYGGSNNFGTVFSIGLTGGLWVFNTLYLFSGGPDGGFPNGGLVQSGDGLLYGTTHYGGTNLAPLVSGGGGTVFKISPSGSFKMLHSFGDSYPGPLFPGTDGNFYGTTSGGPGDGSVFSISPNGAFSNLWQFSGTDGRNPSGPLVQYNDSTSSGYGYLIGTTTEGGSNYNGTIFSLAVTNLTLSNQVLGPIQPTTTGLSFRTPSAAGATYQLQAADSLALANWADVGSPVTGTGGIITLTDPAGSPYSYQQRVYRIKLSAP